MSISRDRRLAYLADLHPVVAASVAEDWDNDARALLEAADLERSRYDRLNGPMMRADREFYWHSWKDAQRLVGMEYDNAGRRPRSIFNWAETYRF